MQIATVWETPAKISGRCELTELCSAQLPISDDFHGISDKKSRLLEAQICLEIFAREAFCVSPIRPNMKIYTYCGD